MQCGSRALCEIGASNTAGRLEPNWLILGIDCSIPAIWENGAFGGSKKERSLNPIVFLGVSPLGTEPRTSRPGTSWASGSARLSPPLELGVCRRRRTTHGPPHAKVQRSCGPASLCRTGRSSSCSGDGSAKDAPGRIPKRLDWTGERTENLH